MRIGIFVSFILCSALLASPVSAQDVFGKPGKVDSGRTEEAVTTAKAALLAMGGADALAGVGACVAEGTYSVYFPVQDSGHFKWINSGDQFRYEYTGEKGAITTYLSNSGRPAEMTNDAVNYLPPNFIYTMADAPHLLGVRLLRHFNDLSGSFGLADSKKLTDNYKNTFVLRMAYPDADDSAKRLVERDWVIDAGSGLTNQLRIIAPGYPNASIQTVTNYSYSGYRSFDGVMAPTQIKMFDRGSLVKLFQLNSLQCGATVDNSQFIVNGGAHE
jgi:hypothetical protein